MKKSGKLFVIAAPSGTGKTTLTTKALPELQTIFDIKRVVTCTSRPAREGEINGQDYYFFTPSEFEQKIKDEFFLEHVKFADNYYGTPKSILNEMKQGTSFILVIDLEGAKRVYQLIPNAIFIWITPPNIASLRERLSTRGTETEIEIQKRIDIAKNEIEQEKQLDLFNYHIVNDVLDDAAADLIDIIRKELE